MPSSRSSEAITKDLIDLSPADAQTVAAIAYQLRYVKQAGSISSERAFARLLKDIINGQGDDVRMAYIEAASA